MGRRSTKAARGWGARPIAVDLAILLVIMAALVWCVDRGGWFDPPAAPMKLSFEAARALNESMLFADLHPAAARPFWFRGSPAAREQAVQCLATAAIYEAGDDAESQEAVMQVVLNRVKLPQYPKTVCGVVYQGASKPTGCQFSFTCDGSVQRRPARAGWDRARSRARRALAGHVFAEVGMATHYHADWVVPYWSPTLDKIAKVRSHIFYRPPR